MGYKFIRNDNVRILVGKDKGKISTISKVDLSRNKVIVKGVNFVTKTVKSNKENVRKSRLKREACLHISNISHIFDNHKLSKVGFKVVNKKKIRYLKKTSIIINKNNINDNYAKIK